jgi:hypothetical protein
VDASSLRRQLALYLGDARFRKFVLQLRRAGRLRYWQEGAWRQFVALHPDCDIPFDALRAALRLCELHGTELTPDTVEVIEGCVDYADYYVRAKVAGFPNAATGPVWTERAPRSAVSGKVWYCPDCRTAEAAWRARPHRG